MLTHHPDSPAVVAAGEDMKVPVISYNTSMKRIAPTMLLGGVVQSWEEFYTGRINAAMDGTWKSQSIWGGIPEHMVNLVDIRSDAPQSVQDDIQAAYNKMAAREFSPFTGPIVTNEGQTVVEAGKTAPDDVLLNMNWLVKGVVGKVPTMN